MSKNTVLGIIAFGGIVLVTILLKGTPVDTQTSMEDVGNADVSVLNDIPPFPIYPNSDVISISDIDGEEAHDISLSLSTDDALDKIHEWYRAELDQNGWKIKSDKNVAGYQIIQGENENLYTSLQASNGSEGTVVISQQLKIRK